MPEAQNGSEKILTFDEFCEVMGTKTEYTQIQIKNLWAAAFGGNQQAKPTLRAVAVVIYLVENISYDDIMQALA